MVARSATNRKTDCKKLTAVIKLNDIAFNCKRQV